MNSPTYFMCSQCYLPYMIKLIPEKKILHKYCRCGNSTIQSIEDLKEQLCDKDLAAKLKNIYTLKDKSNQYCHECNEYYSDSNINHNTHNYIDLTLSINTLSIENNINKIRSFISILNMRKLEIIKDLIEKINEVSSSYENSISTSLNYVQIYRFIRRIKRN